MINTMLEHVPIKMEVKGINEVTHNSANEEVDTGIVKDDDKPDETDEEMDDDGDEEFDDDDGEEEEEDEFEESDMESDTLEIEQEATMLISSDEEAELEAQRIRFPKIQTKKLRKDSNKSSRSSSRNSQTSSNASSKPHITYEIIHTNVTVMEETEKQRISPLLKNFENNKILESFSKENNNSSIQTLLKQKTENTNNKLENNKTLENDKNKPDETSKCLDSIKIPAADNHKNIDNLLKSPVNVSGPKNRRDSNNSTCSISSTIASDSAETESCGNIYVFNLQQRLIFNCEFCDLKYGDLENFGLHLHEVHKLFNLDEDPEKENAPRNMRKSNYMPTNAPKNPNVKKEPLQCLELRAEPPVVLPPSVLAEPLDSCGNVFMLNHRKLFLVCGYCECKYANLEMFEKHLRQQHRIFEGCRNEVNVVPKVEMKEELYIITEVAEKPDVIAPPAMVAIPADIPLDISITPETEGETINALAERVEETSEEAKKEETTSFIPPPPPPAPASPSPPTPPSQLEDNIAEETVKTLKTVEIVVKEQENPPVNVNVVSTTEESEKLPDIVDNDEDTSLKKVRGKKRSSPSNPIVSPNKRPKRITRNNAKVEKEAIAIIVEDKVAEITAEVAQASESEIDMESLPTKDIRETRKSTRSTESMKETERPPQTAEAAKATKKVTDLIASEQTIDIKPIVTRETRKSARAAAQMIKARPPPPHTSIQKKATNSKKVRKHIEIKKRTVPRKIIPKPTTASTKSSEIKKIKQENPEVEAEIGDAKLKCSQCCKEFTRKDSLKIHERTHTGEKPYECEVCHKSFCARANLYIHKKFHMGDSYKKYKCDICEKKFYRNTDRKVHMASHSSEKSFKCGICMRGYSSKLSVKKHIERDHIDKKKSARKEDVSSTKIEEMPTKLTALKEPKRQDTPTSQKDNVLDDLNADPVDEIIEQLQNEMTENVGGNVEANAITFTINAVSGSKAGSANTSTDIRRPIVIGPQLNEIDSTDDVKPTLLKVVKRFFCEMCPRSFEKHIRLVEHKRLHTGEKPFACDECGKQFRIRMRLNEHKLRHSKEKKFKCEICQLACCTKQDLNLHMRHHTNDRRYQCSICPKAFVRSSDLKIHVRVHTGEKPYVCDICHKCFRANQNLSVHKKSHMGEASKTYKCEHCDKKFMRNIDRKVHMRSHTGEKPYKCEICQRGYSSKFNVRAHIERDHISANGVGTPPKGKKKPGPKPKALREELEKQKKLIEELQNQLLQQIKTDEKIIPSEEEMLQENTLQDSTVTATSPLTTASSKLDPIQSAYELLNKLKSSTTTSKPLTVIPSPPPLEEPPSNPFGNATKDSTTLLPLTITQKLEQPSALTPAQVLASVPVPAPTPAPAPAPAPSAITNATTCITTPSPPNTTTTATKVVSQKTSLGIQQVSVTVSMQVENVTPNPTTLEKENAGILTATSSSTTSVKKERKITSYFTVVGQK